MKVLTFFAAAFFLMNAPAYALSCMYMTQEEHIEQSQNVFLGTLSEINKDKGLYKFEQQDTLKGDLQIAESTEIVFKAWPYQTHPDILQDVQNASAIINIDSADMLKKTPIILYTDCTLFPVIDNNPEFKAILKAYAPL